MGEIVRQQGEVVYRQENGEITARLTGFKEITALVHEGSTRYKRVFHLLVAAGAAYLAVIFIFF